MALQLINECLGSFSGSPMEASNHYDNLAKQFAIEYFDAQARRLKARIGE